jgi:3-oxoacyl-[acyl-carrier protein] reductase
MIAIDLTGKAALVTGGASGIGLAVVTEFARCGATVAVNHLPDDDRAAPELERLRNEGFKLISAPGDLARPSGAQNVVGAAVESLGRLDYLINNAGTTGTVMPIDFADLDAMTDEFWEKMVSTNLVSAFRCSRAAAPALRASRGAIVNTASVAGLGMRGSSIAYAASKAGLISVTRSLARALAPEVRVNAVAPGLTISPMNRDWPEERLRRTLDRTLLRRLAQPSDIAEGILFLAASASYITGEVLVIDGGSYLT